MTGTHQTRRKDLNVGDRRVRKTQHALREAFRGLTEPGRHPAAILMLDVPPGDVDVNVHPTKIEVRFKDSGRIHGLVLSSVREKLLGSDLTPSAVPMRADNFETADRPDVRATLAAFFQQLPSELAPPAPLQLQAQAGLAPIEQAVVAMLRPKLRPRPVDHPRRRLARVLASGRPARTADEGSHLRANACRRRPTVAR